MVRRYICFGVAAVLCLIVWVLLPTIKPCGIPRSVIIVRFVMTNYSLDHSKYPDDFRFFEPVLKRTIGGDVKVAKLEGDEYRVTLHYSNKNRKTEVVKLHYKVDDAGQLEAFRVLHD